MTAKLVEPSHTVHDDANGAVATCCASGDEAPHVVAASESHADDGHDHTELPAYDAGDVTRRRKRWCRVSWSAAMLSVLLHVGTIAVGVLIIRFSAKLNIRLVQQGSLDGDSDKGEDTPRGTLRPASAAEPTAPAAIALPQPVSPPPAEVIPPADAVTEAAAMPRPTMPDVDLPDPADDMPLKMPVEEPDPMKILPATAQRKPAIPEQPPVEEPPTTRPTEIADAPATRPAETASADAKPPAQPTDSQHTEPGQTTSGASADATTPSPAPAAEADYPHEQLSGYVAPQPTGKPGSGRRYGRGIDGRGLPIPEYPQESRIRREQGLVIVEVEVLPTGQVGEVKLISGPGYERLHNAAVEAARRADFAVASYQGRPVRGRLQVPYRFVLE